MKVKKTHPSIESIPLIFEENFYLAIKYFVSAAHSHACRGCVKPDEAVTKIRKKKWQNDGFKTLLL